MKNVKNRKLHGSVLFTVVFVMSILIVFLFGTLSLALATNNRAHVNYSSAQTKITSRTVAESAIKALSDTSSDGKAYAKAISKLGTAGNPSSVNVNVSLAGSKAPGTTDDPRLASMGHISPVTVSYAGTKKYYDINKGWIDRDVLKFTATVTQNGVESTTSVYAMKFFGEDTPAPGGGSGGGAGFVTVAGADLVCQTSLFGGSYINLPKWDATAVNNKYPTASNPELKFYEDLSSEPGTRTAASNVGDTVIFPNRDGEKSDYFHQQETSTTMEADVAIYNNLSSGNMKEIYFPDAGKGITVFGNWKVGAFSGNGDHLKLFAGPELSKYYRKEGESKTLSPLAFNKIPYIYVNGKIYGDNNPKIVFGRTTPSFPLNVYCGWIEYASGNELSICADLFCMNAGAENRMHNLNAENAIENNALYGWIGSVINRTEPVNTKTNQRTSNSVYVNGNLTLSGNNHIYGDLRVQGNLTVTDGNTLVEGDLAVGGAVNGMDKITVRGRKFTSTGSTVSTKVIENLSGSWVEWKIKDHMNTEGSYIDPFDRIIEVSDTEVKAGGRTFNIDEFSNGDLNLFYAFEPGVLAVGTEEQLIAGPVTWTSDERKHDPDADWTFYVPTRISDSIDPSSASDAELNAAREIATRMVTNEKNFNIIVDSADSFSIAMFKQLHNNQEIYPKYAERGVLLGLETANDPSGNPIPKAETQVVRTIRDILDEVANPYATTKDDPKILTGYNSAKDIVITSTNVGTYESGGELVITQSCTIDYSPLTYTHAEGGRIDGVNGTSYGKNIVIKPGTGEVFIIVKNLYLSHGHTITVDDSEGGKAYIYIEENGVMALCGANNEESALATKTYRDFIQSSGKTEAKVNTPGMTGVTDIPTEYGVPNLYIYGDKNSLLWIQTFNWISANIISPYLEFSINAQSGGVNSGNGKLNHLYYNGEDLLHPQHGENVGPQLIFGCLNAGKVYSKNVVTNVYIPNDGGEGPRHEHTETPEEVYDYWIMYYTDF